MRDLERRVSRLEKKVGVDNRPNGELVARAEYHDETVELYSDSEEGSSSAGQNIIHVWRDGEDIGYFYMNSLARYMAENNIRGTFR